MSGGKKRKGDRGAYLKGGIPSPQLQPCCPPPCPYCGSGWGGGQAVAGNRQGGTWALQWQWKQAGRRAKAAVGRRRQQDREGGSWQQQGGRQTGAHHISTAAAFSLVMTVGPSTVPWPEEEEAAASSGQWASQRGGVSEEGKEVGAGGGR